MGLNSAGFDSYAAEYEAALEQGISVSGENKDYFAQQRIQWLAGCLQTIEQRPKQILDFGCGTGSAAAFFLEVIPSSFIVGVDISNKSLEVAKRSNTTNRSAFLHFDEYSPTENVDLAFCNGVFHHIPPDHRKEALSYIYRSLRPGGLFAFWENNPWNPGARYVMSRIPFDRDANPLTSSQARRLIRDAGFQVLRTDFLFIFPRVLRRLRWTEPIVSRLPLGAQYQVLCQKPSAPTA